MTTTTFLFKPNRLTLMHPNWKEEDFPIESDDVALLQNCAEQYQQALKQTDNRQLLLDIGLKLGNWLNRLDWLDRLLDEVDAPWHVAFKVSRRAKADEMVFLNAPWELLAWDEEHLAVNPIVKFNPVRQIGEAKDKLKPSPYRLNLMFMAAAPDSASSLSYEAEELAILDATRDRGVDLTVEETGTLAELADEVARYQPDVVHVSCHGGFDSKGNPVLLLEDEEGKHQLMTADDWTSQPSLVNVEKGIKLGFVSACHTANPLPDSSDDDNEQSITDSLAAQLIKLGMPAVLGWGNSVSDKEASDFATYFYQYLGQQQSLMQALGAARWELYRQTEPVSRDWHLARLFLGRYEIGALTKGDKARRLLDAEFGAKAFLDKKSKKVPVAGRAEFVGRRRALQAIIRHVRRPEQYAGVLIHGMGRQGKSSLAARVARRFVDYQVVVVYGFYEAVDILNAFEVLGAPANPVIRRYQSKVRNDPSLLTEALQQLLCKLNLPFLLVIDDVEQALVEPREKDGLYTVQPDLQLGIRALLSSFKQWGGQSRSRLLLTSRYRFLIAGQHGENLADSLLEWHLAPMDMNERRKQLEQKQRLLDIQEKRVFDERKDLQGRCLALGSGNPGLQNQLYVLIRQDAEAAEQTLNQLAAWLKGESQQVNEEQTRDLLEGLVLEKLYGLLSEESQQLLQWSQDFVMPLPIVALQALGGEQAVQSLLTLGLWDGWRDEESLQSAAMLNRLAKRLCVALDAAQEKQIAQQLLSSLWTAWQKVEQRSYQADYQLTRLAVRVIDTTVLQQTAGYGVYWATTKESFTEGKALGLKSIESLENANIEPDDRLLRYTAESCHSTGAIDKALALHQQRLKILPEEAEHDRAVAYSGIADIFQQQGKLDEALAIFQQKLLPVFKSLKNEHQYAVVQGRIAGILQSHGQLDEALRIHQKDILPIVEHLGDVMGKAVTMGKIADILQSRGQLDEALRIRETEQLPVYESLGDVRSKAVTMGQIADILQDRGQLDEALRIYQENIPVREQLGDVRGKAVIQGKIADIYYRRGQLDEALRIRQQEELPVYERLGDVRSKAVTMGQIADILQDRGQLDEALEIRQEQVLPAFEHLGDPYLQAVEKGKIADILQSRGQLDEALRIRQQEELPVYERLGDVRSKAVTMGQIADIL
ncbi:tetratricopeptide repeat protein, partial [Candidatus Albibeggiatoa sp. nov. NOAA]|uniref:tetratricopeptide repeat protein n=1 Tax=Candidatus Albibeggiatoa sp. nov. NOAA TaxID=3162724 RepID=UPI003304F58D|nr:tetratricopeptide repeat protein [Thiotrichaceae bacterium]